MLLSFLRYCLFQRRLPTGQQRQVRQLEQQDGTAPEEERLVYSSHSISYQLRGVVSFPCCPYCWIYFPFRFFELILSLLVILSFDAYPIFQSLSQIV